MARFGCGESCLPSEWRGDRELVFPSLAGFHAFRHLRASQLIAEGRNIVKVSRWLGHHSPSFTLAVYAHLMDAGVVAPLDLDAELRARSSAVAGGEGRLDGAGILIGADGDDHARLIAAEDTTPAV